MTELFDNILPCLNPVMVKNNNHISNSYFREFFQFSPNNRPAQFKILYIIYAIQIPKNHALYNVIKN